jgi:mono/diheme cytochrome c family protein
MSVGISSRSRTLLLAMAALVSLGCGGGAAPDLPPPPAQIPAEFAAGAGAFAQHCASCHGEFGRGTDVGPPLVHPYYVPSHHGDAAFQFAVQRGVAAHHWRFGDMAPLPQVTDPELAAVIPYIRWLQREAGIQ